LSPAPFKVACNTLRGMLDALAIDALMVDGVSNFERQEMRRALKEAARHVEDALAIVAKQTNP
jgi:diketogulonate reductase-like aldo/keto reductase